MKRAIDIVGASSLLLLTLPMLVIAFVLVKLSKPDASGFYLQKRIGGGARPFMMWKLRTMVADAEHSAVELHRVSGRVFLKIENDPRVTPIGKLLRRYSVDELPQLWNVLCGEMSLVGPRPLLPTDLNGLPPDVARVRFAAPPGLTGLWQVSGRSATTDVRRMQLDVAYVRHWSLWLDLRILARTGRAVLRGDGAS